VPLIDRADSLLVVVDTQPGFARHAQRCEAERMRSAETVDRAAWLAEIAWQLSIPALVTEEDPARNGATEPQLAERLADGTPVIPKPTFGLAGTPEIVAAIRATGRRTIVMVGFETDVCVAQSAIGVLELGFRAVVVEDASYSATERQHERGLARMRQLGVELIHCKGLAFEWLRTVDDAVGVMRAARIEKPPTL
jgi:nicotinamidase-related amidase